MELVKGASQGGAAPTPAVFGDYEMGRSKHEMDVRTAPFLDQMKQGVMGFFGVPPGQPEASWRTACNAGDPGAYDPWTFMTDSGERIKKGFTQNPKAFNSTGSKQLIYRLFGEDAPGPEYYYTMGMVNKGAGEAQKYCFPHDNAATITVFTSKSLQRPNVKSEVPGPDRYTPNFMSNKATIRNAGVHMRSKSSRWGIGQYAGTDGTTRERADIGTGPMG